MPAEMTAMVLLPIAVVCAVLFGYRLWKKQWRAGMLVLLLPGACEALAVKSAICIRHDWEGVEMNARVAPADLVGVWRRDSDDEALEFRADGTFLGSTGDRASWTTDGSSVSAGLQAWTVLEKHGRLVLVPERQAPPRADPDQWVLHGLFYRDEPTRLPTADAGP